MDMLAAAVKEKERERDKDKEKEREKDKEKEREKESDLEAALYANCLLLGLEPAVLGQGGGSRVGLFRHSNPRVGEALLHFLLCSLRGPTQSSKDFAGVWPIFDATQSRDFRKIVQGLINDLEAQGSLPRSNSRVSSLATCCGHRFVELLWQLSAHALREVHRRNFPADVAANPLPAPLTEVVSQNAHAASLIPVTKARIALERRRFLENAAAAVKRQSLWSSIAHEMTAEYRALCAEEAYLNKELEKVQVLPNGKGRVDSVANGGPVGVLERQLSADRASECWESLLAHTAHHEKLASGPIEDLIAHREHRYRIDGGLLRSAMDRGLSSLSVDEGGTRRKQDDDTSSKDGSRERLDGSFDYGLEEMRRSDDRFSKSVPALDVAEILRRWTHALQRVHKQALRLARSNDGAGPDLLKDPSIGGEAGHAEAVHSTLLEHRQHLANMQVLMSQLKVAMPGMEVVIADLRQQVNSPNALAASNAAQAVLSAAVLPKDPFQPREDGSAQPAEQANHVATHLELVPPTPALKLPHMTAVPAVGLQKPLVSFPQIQALGALQEMDVPLGGAFVDQGRQDHPSDESIASLKQAVRAAALFKFSQMPDSLLEEPDTNSEHYFTPITSANASKGELSPSRVQANAAVSQQPAPGVHGHEMIPVRTPNEGKRVVGRILSAKKRWHDKDASENASQELRPSHDMSSSTLDDGPEDPWSEDAGEDAMRPTSPPLLMELSTFGDAYDDLLAPMSDFDAEMMP